MDFSHIKERLEQPTTRATSERGELLERFLLRLNPPRVRDGYKPLTPARVGMLMSHIPTDELHYFYQQCDSGNNFSKLWWWYVKVK